MNYDDLDDIAKEVYKELQKNVDKCFNSDWKLINDECSIQAYKIGEELICFFCEKNLIIPNFNDTKKEKTIKRLHISCPNCNERLVIIFDKLPFLSGRPKRTGPINAEDLLDLKILLNKEENFNDLIKNL